MPGTVALVPAEDLLTPDTCDGIDNDGNGTVDDDPVDYPPACNLAMQL